MEALKDSLAHGMARACRGSERAMTPNRTEWRFIRGRALGLRAERTPGCSVAIAGATPSPTLPALTKREGEDHATWFMEWVAWPGVAGCAADRAAARAEQRHSARTARLAGVGAARPPPAGVPVAQQSGH